MVMLFDSLHPDVPQFIGRVIAHALNLCGERSDKSTSPDERIAEMFSRKVSTNFAKYCTDEVTKRLGPDDDVNICGKPGLTKTHISELVEYDLYTAMEQKFVHLVGNYILAELSEACTMSLVGNAEWMKTLMSAMYSCNGDNDDDDDVVNDGKKNRIKLLPTYLHVGQYVKILEADEDLHKIIMLSLLSDGKEIVTKSIWDNDTALQEFHMNALNVLPFDGILSCDVSVLSRYHDDGGSAFDFSHWESMGCDEDLQDDVYEARKYIVDTLFKFSSPYPLVASALDEKVSESLTSLSEEHCSTLYFDIPGDLFPRVTSAMMAPFMALSDEEKRTELFRAVVQGNKSFVAGLQKDCFSLRLPGGQEMLFRGEGCSQQDEDGDSDGDDIDSDIHHSQYFILLSSTIEGT